MDMHMPGMDGLEAARRIRAAEAADAARRTPIVALTANAFAEDREACLAAGMDGFLVKPLDRERLGVALAEMAAEVPTPLSSAACKREPRVGGSPTTSSAPLPRPCGSRPSSG